MVLQKVVPECQYIFITRDGRDCFCSAAKHGRIPQAKDIGKFAGFWKNVARKTLTLSEYPDFINIRFEDLVCSPSKCVKGLMAFLGEEYHGYQIEADRFSATTSAHRSARHAKLLAPIDNKNVGRFKAELSAAEVRLFNRIAGKELKELGYPVDPVE